MRLEPPFRLWNEQIRIELGGAAALFTTRRGGVSTGPYESLNLGLLTGDRRDRVEHNRSQVESLTGRPLGAVRQVHGACVRKATVPSPGMRLEEADGLVTDRTDLAPTVLVADCLPIVVAASGGVAVLHAGWRGLAEGIVGAGVAALRCLGCAGELEAAIGPGARGCCYEVGEEVHRRFASYDALARCGRNLDLAAIARSQLEQCGVAVIHDVGLCTICGNPSWLFSHRRDRGVTGRQAGVAWLS